MGDVGVVCVVCVVPAKMVRVVCCVCCVVLCCVLSGEVDWDSGQVMAHIHRPTHARNQHNKSACVRSCCVGCVRVLGDGCVLS